MHGQKNIKLFGLFDLEYGSSDPLETSMSKCQPEDYGYLSLSLSLSLVSFLLFISFTRIQSFS